VRGGCREACPVRGSVATFSADLGGVANTQMRKTLRAEVEKGFARTAFDRESVDPEAQINLVNKTIGPIGATQ